jgi:hypothetical protein
MLYTAPPKKDMRLPPTLLANAGLHVARPVTEKGALTNAHVPSPLGEALHSSGSSHCSWGKGDKRKWPIEQA